MVKRVVFGEITSERVRALKDVNNREFLFLGILAFVVILFGVWPDPLVEVMHESVRNLIQHLSVSKLG